jgi:hypothetical protein
LSARNIPIIIWVARPLSRRLRFILLHRRSMVARTLGPARFG